jgi:drug/metabolite transporter (DMT)-like permease
MNDVRFPIPLWLILVVGIIAISFSSIFIKWSDAPVSVIAMYRLVITNLLMLPLLWKYREEIRGMVAKDWLLLFWSGLTLGLHFLFWMGSLRYTSVASSTALMSLEPIFVMIGSYFIFKQRTGMTVVCSMLLAISGAVMVGWGDFGISAAALEGDLLSVLGTLAVAFHVLIGKGLRSHMSAFVYSFFVFLIAALVMLLHNLVAGHALTHYAAGEWGIFVLLAVVPTVFGHLLFNWLLKYISATAVSMTVLGEPVGATLLAYLLLGEKVTPLQSVACIILIGGVWLFMRSSSSSGEKARPLINDAA